MINFDELKDKTMAAAGTIADKAKIMGQIARLKTEMARERETARQTYIELGKRCYEENKLNPSPDLAQSVADITNSLDAAAAKQLEIDELKRELGDAWDVPSGSAAEDEKAE